MAKLSAVFDVVDKVSEKLESICGAGDKMADSFNGVESMADKAMSNIESNMNGCADAAENAVKTTENYTDSIKDTDKAAEKASERIGGLGDETEKTSEKSEHFGKKSKEAVSGLDKALATAGIVAALTAIALGFSKCNDAAQEFETTSAKIETVADTTKGSMKSIDKAIIDLSYDTGQAANDLAESTYDAISSGVDTAAAVQFVSDANELAVGGFTSVANSVDVLSTALNSYNLTSDQAGQISDYLIVTQNLGKTTVDELASSVARVIPLASAYNVQMDNLSSAYAVLTSNGIDTAEATTYIRGMLAELADTGSKVSSVLEEKTGSSFANLMENGYSLGDVLQILGDSVDGNATAFSNMWSSMEAGTGALSIFNSGAEKYNSVLEQMQNSQGATSKAFDTMANTSAMAESKMNQAINNTAITIGEKLQPQLNSLYESGSNLLIGAATFVDENPGVIYAIEGTATAFGVMALGITGYTVATKVATFMTEAFTASLLTNPIFLGITAVAVFTGALVGLAAAVNSANEDTVEYTAASQKMMETTGELTNTQDQALQTMDEYRAMVDNVSTSIEESQQKHQEAIDSINSEYDSSIALIAQMDQLNRATNKTEFQHEALSKIVDELNSRYENLGLTYDTVTGSINKTSVSIEKMVKAEAESQKRQADYDLWVQNTVDLQTAMEALSVEEANIAAQEEAIGKARKAYNDTGDEALFTQVLIEEDKLKKFQEDFDTTSEKIKGLQEVDKEYSDKFSENADSNAEAITTQADAVDSAVTSMQDSLNELASQYDEAYAAARESIDGQIGLFDSMKTESDLSVAEMEDALQSQAEYLARYTENLNKAKQFGFDDSLISSLSDGSEESAGRLDALISKIEDLGTSQDGLSDKAKKFVTDFNDSYSKVDTAKGSWSDTVANMSKDYDEKLNEMSASMQESIGKMNLEDEAADAATKTIRAYINGIKTMTGDVTSAIDAVTNATNNALAGTYAPSFNDIPGFKLESKTTTVGANANGTTDSSDVFIAGEEGPELIIGKQGSKVFPTAETDKIVNAVGGGGTSGDKKVTIDINGSGSIVVDKSVDKQSILETIQQNLKPILLNLISQEILEEGDLSYEF